jgi:hypothetical protein
MSNNLIKKINLKTIVMLDVDDTIFPTHWVNQNMINLSSEQSINEYKLYFLELDKTLSEFLINLLSQAKIYFVTNASLKWIKVCFNVLTKTKKIIMENNIRIVSARDNYSQTFLSPTEWKINTFKDIIAEIIDITNTKDYCDTILNIISLGDAQYEYIALLNLDKHFKKSDKNINYLLKSIKFIERPHFDVLINQLQIINKNINMVINKTTYIDLKFIE